MAIVVETVLEPTPRGVRAVVRHEGQSLDVDVAAAPDQLAAVVGRSLVCEMDFETVVRWRRLPGADESDHGLTQAAQDGGAITVVGEIHNVVPVAGGPDLYDVYLRAGPEFITFDADDLPGELPGLGDAVEVVVRGLRFYPSWP